MFESDLVRVRHMLDAVREAVDIGAGRTRDDLIHNRVLALALMRCIEIVGEAAARIGSEMRDQHPKVPWADIVGMRHLAA